MNAIGRTITGTAALAVGAARASAGGTVAADGAPTTSAEGGDSRWSGGR